VKKIFSTGLILVLCTAVSATATTLPTPRVATLHDTPEHEQFVFESTVVTPRCGFPLLLHFKWVTIENRWTYDDGSVRIVAVSAHSSVTLTNPANGISISGVTPEPLRFYYAADGSVTVYDEGIHSLYTVPGVGLVSAATGRIVLFFPNGFGGPQQVIFEAGPHESPFPEICQYLQ
jgi:hypothetical protein